MGWRRTDQRDRSRVAVAASERALFADIPARCRFVCPWLSLRSRERSLTVLALRASPVNVLISLSLSLSLVSVSLALAKRHDCGLGSVCILLCYSSHVMPFWVRVTPIRPTRTRKRRWCGIHEKGVDPMLRNRLTFFLLSAVHQLRRPGVPSLRQADRQPTTGRFGARPPPRQLAEPTTGSRVEVVATAAAPTLRRPRCLGLRQAAAP